MGGAERSVALLAEAQSTAGHEVAASCITPGSGTREIRGGVRVYRMPHETDFWPEEWPQHSVLERGVRRFKQQFNYKLERHFGEVMDDFRPEIVHTHSLLDVSTRVWLAAQARRTPIVHTLRDYDLACANAAMFREGRRCTARHLKCRLFTFMKYYHQRVVDAVVGVGAAILASHLELGYFRHVPERFRRVIWNPAAVEGIGANYVRPSRTGKPLTFGYLGRINVEKGVGTLLNACRTLPHSTWKLLIAGKAADEQDELRSLASGLPVEFLGFVAARELLEAVDVLVVPSIWAEPLPRSILEAYAAGVPVIGADSGGIPDLIGRDNHDWLFPVGDAAELAKRMQAVIARGRGSLPGRSNFQHILDRTTPARVVQEYDSLYQELRCTSMAAATGS